MYCDFQVWLIEVTHSNETAIDDIMEINGYVKVKKTPFKQDRLYIDKEQKKLLSNVKKYL